MVGGEADCPVDTADILDNKRIKRQDVWVPWDSHDAICLVPPVGNIADFPVIKELNFLRLTRL
jgi:hypothetical protein